MGSPTESPTCPDTTKRRAPGGARSSRAVSSRSTSRNGRCPRSWARKDAIVCSSVANPDTRRRPSSRLSSESQTRSGVTAASAARRRAVSPPRASRVAIVRSLRSSAARRWRSRPSAATGRRRSASCVSSRASRRPLTAIDDLDGPVRDGEADDRHRQNASAPDPDAAHLGGQSHLVGRQKVDVDHESARRARPAATASAGPRRSSCCRSTLGPISRPRKGNAIETGQPRRASNAAASPGREDAPPESTAPPSGTAGPGPEESERPSYLVGHRSHVISRSGTGHVADERRDLAAQHADARVAGPEVDQRNRIAAAVVAPAVHAVEGEGLDVESPRLQSRGADGARVALHELPAGSDEHHLLASIRPRRTERLEVEHGTLRRVGHDRGRRTHDGRLQSFPGEGARVHSADHDSRPGQRRDRGQPPATDFTHQPADGCSNDGSLAHEMALHHAGRQRTDRHRLDPHAVRAAIDGEELDAARADVERMEAERAARSCPPRHACPRSKPYAPRRTRVSARWPSRGETRVQHVRSALDL